MKEDAANVQLLPACRANTAKVPFGCRKTSPEARASQRRFSSLQSGANSERDPGGKGQAESGGGLQRRLSETRRPAGRKTVGVTQIRVKLAQLERKARRRSENGRSSSKHRELLAATAQEGLQWGRGVGGQTHLQCELQLRYDGGMER